MTLSFNKLNEIAGLYESIAASEQEQLDEDLNDRIKQGLTGQAMSNAFKKSGGFNSPGFKKLGNSGGLENSIKQGLTRQAMANAYNKSSNAPTPAKPAAKPAASAPAASAPAAAKPAAAKPAAAKVTPTKPATAAAGKSGMDIWKAKYANTLAKNVNPNGTQKGTGQSTMSKDAAELRSMQSKSTLKQSFEYDAYDLVLEYLLSQGHAETVAEAQYLMTEMDAEMIGDIVEGSISSRASNAVGHQRAGTLGDDDEIRKNQDATSASIGKMKRGSGAKVTPTLPGV